MSLLQNRQFIYNCGFDQYGPPLEVSGWYLGDSQSSNPSKN